MDKPEKVIANIELVKSLTKSCKKSYKDSTLTDEQIKEAIEKEFSDSGLMPTIKFSEDREVTVSCEIPNDKVAQGMWGGFQTQGKWTPLPNA